MSTTIDQKVVEMRFDNRHFESNVATTMSTLDKLKQRLNLNGASKGLEDVSVAAKKVDLSGISSGVDTVGLRFNALYTIADQALRNITNSAMAAGKRMVSALTIDPVKTGLSEYETKINAIQVIQANTQGKNSMEDITKALGDLNEYADKTIYNFAQMTSNVGKFTAQGYKVEDAANAVKGLANLAAASGASAEDMARATYQMSQAMGSSIKLMDWNSLRNANMATQDLKDTLIALAKTHGIAIDDMIEKAGTFEYTLQDGWLTGDMFTEAMNIYSGVYSDAELKAKGFTKSQIENFNRLAATAESAATEVKTFTQLWDVLKETAQSGWTQTWETIIGDFDTAKKMWTDLQNYFSGIINAWSDARNFLIGGALNIASPWNAIMEKLNGAGLGKVKETLDSLKDVADIIKYYQKVVNKVWRGDYKRSDTGRYKLLEAAGYNHKVVQDLVNLGYKHKITIEDIENSHKKFGLTLNVAGSSAEDVANALNSLSDEQLRNAGLTEDEIRLYRDLEAEAKRTGVTIDELVDKMTKRDGRTLLIESFKNAWSGLLGIFKALKGAWNEIFPPMSVVRLYNIIDSINQFSEKLRLTDKETGELTGTAKKLQRVFKGVFAVLDIIVTLLGGGFKIAFKILEQVLNYFGMDVLDLAAHLGDCLVKFRDWVDSALDFSGVIEKIVPSVQKAIAAIKEWFKGLKNNKLSPKEIAQGIVNGFSKAIEFVKNLIVSGFKSAPADMISGFAKGIWSGIKTVGLVMIELGKIILAKFREVLGIQSPSKETKEDGKNFIQGFVNGIKEFSIKAWNAIKNFGKKCIDMIRGFDFGKVLAVVLSAGILLIGYKFASALHSLAAPLDGLGEMFEGIGDMFSGIGSWFKAGALKKMASAILTFAIAIGILALSVGYLTRFKPGELFTCIGAIATLGVVLVALAAAIKVISGIGSGNVKDTLGAMVIAATLLLLAIAIQKFASINLKNSEGALKTLAGIAIAMAAMAGVLTVLSKGVSSMDKAGSMMFKMSIALLIMVAVVKAAGKVSRSDLQKGLIFVAGVGTFFAAIVAVSKLAGEHAKRAGSMLLKMSIAMLLMVAVVKLASNLSASEVDQGISVIAKVELLFAAFIVVSKIAGDNASKAGGALFKMAIAMAIMIGVVKLASMLDDSEIERGGGVVTALAAMFAALMVITRFGGQAKHLGGMLLKLSVALLILTGVIFLLGNFNTQDLIQGMAAITILIGLMGGLIAVTHLAKDSAGMSKTLILLMVSVALLAGIVVGLSFLDPASLKNVSMALSSLIGTFALLIAATKFAKGAEKSATALLMLVGVVLALGLVLKLMQDLGLNASITNAAALGALLTALSTSMLIMSNAKAMSIANIGGALLGMAGLAAVLALLGLVLAMMTALHVSDAITNATVLSGLLIVLTGVAVIMSIFGTLWVNMLAGALGLAALVGVIALIGLVLAMMEALPTDNAEHNAKILSDLLVTMSDICVKLAFIGPLALIGVGAMTALTGLMLGIGVLAVAIGALMEKFPSLQSFLDTGIPVLEQLAHGIGSIAGNLIAGFSEAAANSLPFLGEQLSKFMENVTPFIDGCKNVDGKVLAGVAILAGAVLAFTAANLIDGILSLAPCGSSFVDLGTKLSQFMKNATPFIEGASGISEEMMTGVKMLAETVLILTAANVIDGLTSWLTGGSSLEQFANQLPSLGLGLAGFRDSIGTFTDEQVATVTAAANAVKILASAAATIPNTGGLLASLVGDNDLGVFAAQFPVLGSGLANFLTNVGTFTEDQVSTVTCAADAIKVLAEASSKIPNTGGWLAAIVGDNDLGTFAAQFPKLGTGIAGMLTNLGTFTEQQVATVTCAADAIKALAEASSNIPNTGGWLAKIVGDNDLGTFASQLPKLGEGVKGFTDKLGTFGKDKVATVNAGVAAIKAIAELANVNGKNLKSNISAFNSSIDTIAVSITEFVSGMISLGAKRIDQAISNVHKLGSMIDKLGSVDTAAANKFKLSLRIVGKNGVKEFVNCFTGSGTTKSIKDSVSSMINAFTDGANAKLDSLRRMFSNLVSNATTALKAKSVYDSAYSAGSYIVDGFAAGISKNTYKVRDKASAMAKAALKAANAALLVQSPSKKFYETGEYAGLGFVNALDDYAVVAYDAGFDMADSARKGLSNTIGKITDMLNSDMDMQPTIRPVLDLSEVRAGAGAIGGMLNTRASVGVAGSISSMMNGNRQNGNLELVSEIKKLRKDVNNLSNTSYNVNGVTYDDGSNISDAVKSLIRAAKIERRV